MKDTFKIMKEPDIEPTIDKIKVTLTFDKIYLKEIFAFWGKLKKEVFYDWEIKKKVKRKTDEQRKYAWKLIQTFADGKNPPMHPMDVYRELARDYAPYDIMAVCTDGLYGYIKRWESQGSAWFCEILDKSEKWTKIRQTYGMSVWNKDEISYFIEILKDNLNSEGIPYEREI